MTRLPLADELRVIRRHIHKYPEVGPEQPATVRFIAEHLCTYGLEPELKGGGCVCDIVGTQPGLIKGFRADMDALELTESNKPDYPPARDGYRSVHPGKMHACGHDFHCAILLGLARSLTENRDRLPGTVRLLFQPGEEGHGGAKRMIAAGALEGLQRVYALHVWPRLPVGRIAYRPGVFFAAISKLAVTVTGKGGHGAMPHLATDQVLIGAKMICDLQSIVSRRLDPLEPAVISICYISAGKPSADNVIPAQLEFRGTVRTISEATQHQIGEELKRILEQRARMEGDEVQVAINYHPLYRATVNTPEVCAEVAPVLAQVLGAENVDGNFPITMGAEDFSDMLTVVPGMMFWLGAGTPGTNLENVPMLHHPAVQLDEACLLTGVQLFTALALAS